MEIIIKDYMQVIDLLCITERMRKRNYNNYHKIAL